MESNQVLDTIMQRRSIRAYKPDQISEDQLEALIKTALISPTASNRQKFHFTVVQNKEIINELEEDVVRVLTKAASPAILERINSRKGKIIFDAPTLIVLSAEPTPYAALDAGIAVQSLALAAKSMGLDSVILGMIAYTFQSENAEEWKKRLLFPEGYEFTIGIAIGYGNMPGNEREINREKLSIIK